MTGERREYRLYYSDLDALLLGCVHPLVRPVAHAVERCYWQRHYTGGPHLRVVFEGRTWDVRRLGSSLAAAARTYMTAHPSEPVSYSVAAALRLLQRERERVDAELLRYRNNEVLELTGAQPRRFLSAEAEALAANFCRDAMDLTAAIVAAGGARRYELLRVYALYAYLLSREPSPRGFIAFKSHWEGFAAGLATPEAVIRRARDLYTETADRCRHALRDTAEHVKRGTIDGDPILREWSHLHREYRLRVRRLLADGCQIAEQPDSLASARAVCAHVRTTNRRPSAFVDALFEDERFMAVVQFDHDFLTARALTNLLYMLVAAAGLTALDKNCLCYFAYRAAEDLYGCNLTDMLRTNVEASVARYGHRLAAVDGNGAA